MRTFPISLEHQSCAARLRGELLSTPRLATSALNAAYRKGPAPSFGSGHPAASRLQNVDDLTQDAEAPVLPIFARLHQNDYFRRDLGISGIRLCRSTMSIRQVA